MAGFEGKGGDCDIVLAKQEMRSGVVKSRPLGERCRPVLCVFEKRSCHGYRLSVQPRRTGKRGRSTGMIRRGETRKGADGMKGGGSER
jgi:hypothetical protein